MVKTEPGTGPSPQPGPRASAVEAQQPLEGWFACHWSQLHQQGLLNRSPDGCNPESGRVPGLVSADSNRTGQVCPPGRSLSSGSLSKNMCRAREGSFDAPTVFSAYRLAFLTCSGEHEGSGSLELIWQRWAGAYHQPGGSRARQLARRLPQRSAAPACGQLLPLPSRFHRLGCLVAAKSVFIALILHNSGASHRVCRRARRSRPRSCRSAAPRGRLRLRLQTSLVTAAGKLFVQIATHLHLYQGACESSSHSEASH